MKSFTLIETLTAIFIFSFLMVTVFNLILHLYYIHRYEWQQALAVQEARQGIEIMAKEIREARDGENGAYLLELAGDKEIIFYSDIDNDGKVEKVRYFLGEIQNEVLTQKCVGFLSGPSCQVSFSNFLKGKIISAILKVSVEGDLGSQNEYVDIYVDGEKLGRLCERDCTDCAGKWEGTQAFDVLSFATDDQIIILAKASDKVDSKGLEPKCNWEETNHTLKVLFELEIKQEVQGTTLKKGVIKPTLNPPSYPLENEKVTIITNYVRNSPPIFEYYDKEGKKIEDYPARLKETKLIKIFLVVNVDPKKPPNEYQLTTFVFPRNLK